jgi:hypothetical protein
LCIDGGDEFKDLLVAWILADLGEGRHGKSQKFLSVLFAPGTLRRYSDPRVRQSDASQGTSSRSLA